MKIRERVTTIILYAVFICYTLLLIKILFLSRVSIGDLFDSHRTVERSFNFIPFNSISEFISGSSANLKRFASANLVGNMVIFVPLGVYLPLLKNNKTIASNLLVIVLVSLFVEFIQGLFGIGTADIDDVILNSVGGWLGIMLYKTLKIVLRQEERARMTIALLSAVIGLPIIYYYLFMIKMRF
ncbi:VanZ family protein [Paenibacillus glycanilyticus]|uniref:VanZ-like domain-containing protein n=1 Tax=Paenibacillus glycanilyticus TaxID=126569 RepID=A0ABQ6GKQ4_9BACL|nr:VanZ family protein [Paenibacillus glycanilyticus]GLX70645.1 hypothetical protein MU1_49910 [Paenibacillus glycanilyticus]